MSHPKKQGWFYTSKKVCPISPSKHKPIDMKMLTHLDGLSAIMVRFTNKTRWHTMLRHACFRHRSSGTNTVHCIVTKQPSRKTRKHSPCSQTPPPFSLLSVWLIWDRARFIFYLRARAFLLNKFFKVEVCFPPFLGVRFTFHVCVSGDVWLSVRMYSIYNILYPTDTYLPTGSTQKKG